MTADFPEDAFPVSRRHSAHYAERVELGRSRMRQRRAVIAGLVRDAIDVLPATIERIERLGEMLADYRVVVYENDSVDGTQELLQAWAGANDRVVLRCEVLGHPVNEKNRCPRRGDRMADYRNQYHRVIAERFADFDNVIVADMDLPGGWSDAGVANSFGWDDWDFLGANGVIVQRVRWRLNAQLHFDTWAFRRHGSFAPVRSRLVNQYQWRRGEPLESVYSCFGGLGIYRTAAFLATTYAGGDCEHVALHRGMRDAGFQRTFLNPSQLVFYGRKAKRFDELLRTYNSVLSVYTGIAAPA